MSIHNGYAFVRRSLVCDVIRACPVIAGRRTSALPESTKRHPMLTRHLVRPLQADERGLTRTMHVFFLFFFNSSNIIYTPSIHFFSHNHNHNPLLFSSLYLLLSNMDPNNFLNSNGTNDGMQIFGSNDDARWPGHKNYRVETPGSVGFTYS